MINEAKYDMRGFVLNQISSKKISVDDSKFEQIIEQVNAAVSDASQYTDWEVKSNIHEELKTRLRSILDKHQLPIIDELFEEVLSRAKSTAGSPKSFWFVGASHAKGSEDQTERFLNDGVWQNGYEDKYLDVVRMQPGDKIAIKSSYTRKRELPFDNKDQTVSVMGIKAIGVITRNHGDGRFVDVEWQPRFEPVNEWYFYTNLSTIWRVSPDDWMTEGLIDFTFNNKSQDIDRFRNAPYWKERFGENSTIHLVEDSAMTFKQRYIEYVDHTTKSDGPRTIYPNAIQSLAKHLSTQEKKSINQDTIYAKGSKALRALKDRLSINGDLYQFNVRCNNQAPSAAVGKLIEFKIAIFDNQWNNFKRVFPEFVAFNLNDRKYLETERNYKDSSITEAQNIINDFVVETDNAGNAFLHLIELGNFFSWRDKENIQILIQSDEFIQGLKLLIQAVKNDHMGEGKFEEIKKYLCDVRVETPDKETKKIAANEFLQLLTFSFFLYQPKRYFAMKSRSIRRLMALYGLQPFKNGSYINYQEFLYIQSFAQLIFEYLEPYRVKDYIDVQSFLWVAENLDKYIDEKNEGYIEGAIPIEEDEVAVQSVPIEPYTIDDIISDGCFLERESIARIITQLKHKKNLILQGPPGTGKTWLAKKLAYAWMKQKDENSLRVVQFHPNLSYEDFVRGWRPSSEGKLTLVDGPFLEMVGKAKANPDTKMVVIIEEINRGNPAQIFGEMLTLLENDKRTPDEALELSYRRDEGEKIHIPKNLYIIGTMNIADRSLALVDLALRRRFAFFDLKPTFGKAWRNWVNSKAGINIEFLERIERRLTSLNNEIAADRNLGPQFKIGHSYVTPPLNTKIEDASAWFHGVVETEIGPLLEEYWFDDSERAKKARESLVKNIKNT